MYVCMVQFAGEKHGLTAQPQNAGIANFSFLGSQNSVGSIEHGGRGGNRSNAERQRRVEESDNLSSKKEEN